MTDFSRIFTSDNEYDMPGHLDNDLYCQQWVRLSMLWEQIVSRFEYQFSSIAK